MFKKGRGIQNKSEKPKKNNKRVTSGKAGRCTNFATACSNFTGRRCKTTENACSNRKKITSRRVTLPLKLFSQGVKSETVHKNANGRTLNQQSRDFLNEDLHAFLQTVSESNAQPLQSPHYYDEIRSKHTARQNPDVLTHYTSVAEYYVKLESQQELTQGNQEEHSTNENGNDSLFKKINYHFQNILAEQKIPPSNRSTEATKTSSFAHKLTVRQSGMNLSAEGGHFCKKLEKQLTSVTMSSRKTRCIERIKTLVAEIDTILDGREIPYPLEKQSQSVTKHKGEELMPATNLQLISKSNWLYKTPRRQKLRQPVVSSCSNELKSCILQKDVEAKATLNTSITNLDFVDKRPNASTYITFARTSRDRDNSFVFNHLSFVEDFKLPQAFTPKAAQTNLLENMPTRRNVLSLLNNNTIPVFQDFREPTRKALMPAKNTDSLFSHQPIKIAKTMINGNTRTPTFLCFDEINNHQLFSLKRLKEVKSTEESEKIAKNVTISPPTKKNYLFRSNKKCTPSVTPETYFQLPSRFDSNNSNKQNYRPQDFSNHPSGSGLQRVETLVTDGQFLLPPMPELIDSSPLPLYSAKLFDAE